MNTSEGIATQDLVEFSLKLITHKIRLITSKHPYMNTGQKSHYPPGNHHASHF